MKRYQIVEHTDHEELSRLVEQFLAEQWELQGGVTCYHYDDNVVFAQAVTKYEADYDPASFVRAIRESEAAVGEGLSSEQSVTRDEIRATLSASLADVVEPDEPPKTK